MGRQGDRETRRQGEWQSTLQSPAASTLAAANSQLATDPGTDIDRDTLTDFTEVRLGTSKVISDTDDDGINDNLEVRGFPLGGQTWYTNPLVQDSNADGLGDLQEWGIDSAGALPLTIPTRVVGWSVGTIHRT